MVQHSQSSHQVGPYGGSGSGSGSSGGGAGARPGPSYPPSSRPPKRARPGAGSGSGSGSGSKPLSPRAAAFGGGGGPPSSQYFGQYNQSQYIPQEATHAGGAAPQHPVAMQTSPVLQGMASPPDQHVGYVAGGPRAGPGAAGPNSIAFGSGGAGAAAEDTTSVAGTVSSFASASPSASVAGAGGGMGGGGAPGSEYVRRCHGCQQPKPQSAYTQSQWRKGRQAKCVPCTEIDRRVAEAVTSARQCASCRQSKDRASFSTRQWTQRGRCIGNEF